MKLTEEAKQLARNYGDNKWERFCHSLCKNINCFDIDCSACDIYPIHQLGNGFSTMKQEEECQEKAADGLLKYINLFGEDK